MPETFVGAAPDHLDALAATFRAAADRLRSTHAEIGALARAVPWDGPDAQHFRVDWDGRGTTFLRSAADTLTAEADELVRQASGQRQASAAVGSVVAGTGGTALLGFFTQTVPAPHTAVHWRNVAYARAGIDPTTWRPGQGLAANDRTVQDVYDYYGDLYERDPSAYQWAGMAKLAGATFYGGWQDLEAIANIADDTERAARLEQWLAPLIPRGTPRFLIDQIVAELSRFTQEEIHELLSLYFLPMHRMIFDDMASMHEAYDAGGMAEMRRLDAAGQLPAGMLQAWTLIDSGDPDDVATGNRMLLHREQHDVIQDAYDRMYHHDEPVGRVFTQLLTWVGESPIEGGRPYREVVTQFVGVDVPSAEIGVHSPESVLGVGIPSFGVGAPTPEVEVGLTVPRGNVAHFDDRWEWIDRDMLPAYRRFTHDHPERMHALMRTPVSELARARRMFPGLPAG